MNLKTLGLQHVALNVKNLEKTVEFYTKLFNMKIVWQPDSDNYYLSSGLDNLALHRASPNAEFAPAQHLDHLGFLIASHAEVDQWHEHFVKHNVPILQAPKTHRDGARSFYCKDPDGNVVQLICIQAESS